MINHFIQHSPKILPGSPTARLDVEVLLCQVLKVNRAYLYAHSERELDIIQKETFEKLLRRRKMGEPIAYLTGHQEFWSLDLWVNQEVLIPRPETEILVESVLAHSTQHKIDLLELGTGSGAIAIAIAYERPHWTILATDKSVQALALAKENAARLGVHNIQFFLSDWFESVPEIKFDMIVSNPPYLADNDSHLNEGDVRFEPRSALVSGKEGLDDIKLIASEAKHHLKSKGYLFLEHGYDQAEEIRDFLSNLYYYSATTQKDLSNHDRVTFAQYGE